MLHCMTWQTGCHSTQGMRKEYALHDVAGNVRQAIVVGGGGGSGGG